MGRIKARDLLFKLVFELCFLKPEETISFDNFEIPEENKEFVVSIYTGIIERFDELIKLISENIVGYKIDRLFKVDLAILLIAFYEILFYKQTPFKVVANEAVELAKKYSTQKSPSFINGVISKLI